MSENERHAATPPGDGQPAALPAQPFPVAHSLLDAAALLGEVARVYPIDRPAGCELFRAWANDVYRVRTADATYFLKVYRFGWRSASEIAYELDVLAHMAARNVEVALPIPRRDGRLIGTLPAPEGARHAVLFSAAPGVKPRRPFDATLYYRFGRATARLHHAADDFASPHPRAPLDLTHFIDAPLAALGPRLVHRPDDRDYLIGLTSRARARLAALAAGLDWGVCHGDLSLDNAHVSPDGRVIFYDFDSGGPGWRAADVYGVFQFAALDQNGFWDAFLAGYREERPFNLADLAAIPWFVVAQAVCFMGHEAGRWAGWAGVARVDDSYFDRQFAMLRRWEAEQLTEERS